MKRLIIEEVFNSKGTVRDHWLTTWSTLCLAQRKYTICEIEWPNYVFYTPTYMLISVTAPFQSPSKTKSHWGKCRARQELPWIAWLLRREKENTPVLCWKPHSWRLHQRRLCEYLIQAELDRSMSPKAMIYNNRTFIFPRAKQLWGIAVPTLLGIRLGILISVKACPRDSQWEFCCCPSFHKVQIAE